MKKLLIFFLLVVTIITWGQTNPPKQEIRGAWIATVSNIDWPSNVGTSSSIIQQQKQQLIYYLDELEATGINTIYFQIRTTCDALYKSAYEPWSAYLTGGQGTPPSDPNYDPLTFAIEECHKRGMELHAWVNPYRALLTNGNVGNLSSQHIINTHPQWIIKCDGTQYRFLNPGLPQVRNYVTNVCMDIVNNYDIDGLHMDDYFYPYSSYGTYNDDTTFANHPNGFSSKSSWRKNNVNMLLRQIYDSLLLIKPHVKFSISPGGNPMNFGDVYIDPPAWLAGTYTDESGTFH
ncbi:MAG: family 10 glycosylhydrolase, partial [Ignavibacteriales bacterium]|nr:family 10 glycosylhydrolase [Ignavibacteriales bacterium]